MFFVVLVVILTKDLQDIANTGTPHLAQEAAYMLGHLLENAADERGEAIHD